MNLTSYFRSTAAYRVRIALNIKGLNHQIKPINLYAGEHHQGDFKNHNPQALLPTLTVDGEVLTQSLAIIEYLEEQYPQPPLLPNNAVARTKVRAMALSIASDLHPLNNLRVLKFLTQDLGLGEQDKIKWYHHWLKQSFDAIETQLEQQQSANRFCFGHAPTVADLCLIPQVYNAHRFEFSMQDYPLINAINQHCLTISAFARARPQEQSDYEGKAQRDSQ